MAAPTSLTIRCYQVGFGDCFLLSFGYPRGREKHLLIDFGSTAAPEGVNKSKRMMQIAEDIKQRTGGQLDAIVATHRHADHISGFETKADGKGTGNVIRGLKPKLVIQPWTEDPKIAEDAAGPTLDDRARARKRKRSLTLMHAAAEQVLAEAKSGAVPKAMRAQLSFLGEENLANLSAVKNLMGMAPNNYVFHGKKSGLARIIPGVKIDVLGPPTLKQTATIKNQRSRDPDEFWHFRVRAAAAAGAGERLRERPTLFPKYVASRGPFPVNVRWLVYRAKRLRAEQLLQIVRVLDGALNNTSVILFFEIGDKLLLFPGDAQLENWQFALDKDEIKERLKKVDLYKVGHHGSLNATPKSLWALFGKRTRTAPKSLTTLMSTRAGKHGHEEDDTEVPRRTLVSALKRETTLFTTEDIRGDSFFKDVPVPL
jgi:hypothetical protein